MPRFQLFTPIAIGLLMALASGAARAAEGSAGVAVNLPAPIPPAATASRARQLLNAGQTDLAERMVRAALAAGADDLLLCLSGEIQFQGLLKELPGLGASAGLRVVWRQRDEFRGRLQENVSRPEAAIRELEPQGASVLAEMPELGRGLKVRTALKESNVHTLKAQHRNEVQCLIVRKQRKGEIGGGQSGLHILWGLLLRDQALDLIA